ncbi:hypothetical protein AJ78_04016 [Emergomyces pasteurianus Ep9510]|uniref:MAGE domain-containing protein n=1 Tax=Emergomyces pasteurianus Ep9510 TaxID=1447872 RepID=A0A1J9QHY1_9EURO|nr:hypothetical protein AJ78_04016 [Emergomyces pasteurianus Ep9510]
MPVARNRRRVPDDEADSNSDTSSEPQPRQQKRQRRQASSDSDSYASADGGMVTPPDASTQANTALEVMVKKLVRLALASEYSRQVIRRTDIRDKVLGEQGARQFRQVFEGAQRELKEKFGMQMVEQPLREKVTISQRRAAQRTEKPATTSKTWTVITTLPNAYRIPTILPPSKAPSSMIESTYTALYTFIISTILLSGGSIREQKLDRLLRRVNADNFTPIDRTDRLLARLCKEGYIVRNREMDGGEEVVEYLVGPRGKVEVGVAGVSGLAREVYGFGEEGSNENGNGDGDGDGDGGVDEGVGVGVGVGVGAAKRQAEVESFEKRLKRSLGIREPLHFGREDADADADADTDADGGH